MRMIILLGSARVAPSGAPAHTRRAQCCESNEREAGGACARGAIASRAARADATAVDATTTIAIGVDSGCAMRVVAIGCIAAECFTSLQHARRIDVSAGGSAFFGGQQHESRTSKSTSHRNRVRANAVDGNKIANASKLITARRTTTCTVVASRTFRNTSLRWDRMLREHHRDRLIAS
jgi:hypothetical protein